MKSGGALVGNEVGSGEGCAVGSGDGTAVGNCDGASWVNVRDDGKMV